MSRFCRKITLFSGKISRPGKSGWGEYIRIFGQNIHYWMNISSLSEISVALTKIVVYQWKWIRLKTFSIISNWANFSIAKYPDNIQSPSVSVWFQNMNQLKVHFLKTSVALATESSGYVWSRTPIVLTHKLWIGWLFSCLWQLPRTKMLVIGQWSRSIHLHRP